VTPAPDDPENLRLAEINSSLVRTPLVVDAWLREVPDGWLDADEGPGTWSPRQVIMHLAWAEVDDWLPRVRIIVDHGATRPFAPFDREAGFRHYAGWAMPRLLDEFARLRGESLAGIAALGLTDADLERPGRHPEFGVVTLGQLLATWVTHDLTHLTQIGRVLTRHAGRASGPWRAYFSLLRVSPPEAPPAPSRG
jgi:hypothetical protein